MTSKLKCPFCSADLRESTYGIYSCPNVHCAQAYNHWGSPLLWQALIQAKQDLGIATKALYEICNDYQEDSSERAEKALKQITHDNSEKANSQIEYKE